MAATTMAATATATATATAPTARRQYVELMHHRAMHQVNAALAVCLASPRSADKWTALRRDAATARDGALFARKSGTARSVCFLGVNELHCGFDEVYALLNYQSTPAFALTMKLLLGRRFRDGAVLSNHAPREYDGDYDVADVQHSALWLALQARREAVLGRDNLLSFFQALMVLHPDRSAVGASTTLSSAATNAHANAVTRPSETVHKRTLALAWLPFHHVEGMAEVRESMRLTYTLIIEEVARHRLRLSCVVASFRDGDDLSPARSASAVRAVARRLVNCTISRLESAVIAARISTQPLVLPHQWVKNEDRPKCNVCWKPFHALIRRRHHCRLCGEVICGSCSSLRDVSTRALEIERVRVCHMCSNRGDGGAAPRRRRTNSFASGSSRALLAAPSAGGSTIDSLVFDNSRIPILERDREDEDGDGNDDDDDDDAGDGGSDAFSGGRQGSAHGGSGYLGYIGAFLGAVSSGSQKLISLRSMTRAELVARSTSTTASQKQSDSSHASSTQRRRHRRSPPPPPPQNAAPYYGPIVPAAAVPMHSLAERLSISFLHPSIHFPSVIDAMPPSLSIVADVGSQNTASHERPSSAAMAMAPRANGSAKHELEDSFLRADHVRRTSMMSLAHYDDDRTSGSDYSKLSSVTAGSGGVHSNPKLDAVREHQRLKLMNMLCSPACTLVDRMLMRACCERAAAAFGVRGAFIARVEETYVVLEHVVGTANLSAIDHFLRADTPCDHVLVAKPGARPFCVADCSADPRLGAMVMVRDLDMRFFVGVSILVRGLPIACLCAFSENDDSARDEDELARLSSVSVSQNEFKVLHEAAQRITDELERLVHGLEIC